MKTFWVLLILSSVHLAQAANFSLGADFWDTSLDGRIGFTEKIYMGLKLDPGIDTRNNDIDLDLDFFARFNLIPIVPGFSLGPEAGLQLVENGDVDNPVIFINFHSDLVIPLQDRLALYGHLPLIGFNLFLGNLGEDNGPGNNNNDDEFALRVFSDLPIELGFLFQF